MKKFEDILPSTTIDKVSTRQYRLMLISFATVLLSNLFWGFWYWETTKEAGQKVYVRSGKTVFSAQLENVSDERNLHQVRGMIATAMSLLYATNAENYKEQLNEALGLLTSKDGQAIVLGFNEQKVLENHVRYNSFAKIELDSLMINMNVEPYPCQVLMKQHIFYDGKEVINPIGVTFDLSPSLYTDENPFGLIIENYNYIKYQPQDQ